MWTWECQGSLLGDPHTPAVPGHCDALSDIQLCKMLEPLCPPGSAYNLLSWSWSLGRDHVITSEDRAWVSLPNEPPT